MKNLSALQQINLANRANKQVKSADLNNNGAYIVELSWSKSYMYVLYLEIKSNRIIKWFLSQNNVHMAGLSEKATHNEQYTPDCSKFLGQKLLRLPYN